MSWEQSSAEAQRLLAHVEATETRWFKVSAWMVERGLKGVPDHKPPRNPVKRLVAQLGCLMSNAQMSRINRRHPTVRKPPS